jgi:hypothetical protein
VFAVGNEVVTAAVALYTWPRLWARFSLIPVMMLMIISDGGNNGGGDGICADGDGVIHMA